jgi:putative endonuclease
MTYKSQLGQFGENLACEYLVEKGYKIIDRNFRKKWGELDIITKAPDKTLVFVEVKTMTENSGVGLKPEDQLTRAKLEKLKRTACLYAGHYPKKVKDKNGWRIDLLALSLPNRLSLNIAEGVAGRMENCDIRHYENIG